jgi:hypothetical protein
VQLRATVACALLLRPWVLRAACDRGVRASEGTFERTQVQSNVLWQLLFFKSFLALANHVSTQCPAQHKIPKTLEND